MLSSSAGSVGVGYADPAYWAARANGRQAFGPNLRISHRI